MGSGGKSRQASPATEESRRELLSTDNNMACFSLVLIATHANIKEVGSDYLVAMPWARIDCVHKVAIDFDATTQIRAKAVPASRPSQRYIRIAIPCADTQATVLISAFKQQGSYLV